MKIIKCNLNPSGNIIFSYFAALFIATSPPLAAHHTKEHTMFMENSEKVIAETVKGGEVSWLWLIWVPVIVAFSIGIWRRWKIK